jgi:hypothetical protein
MLPLGKGLDLSSSSIISDRGDGDGQDLNTSVHSFVEVPSSNEFRFKGIPLLAANGKKYAFGREAVYVGLQTGSTLLKAADVINSPDKEILGRAVVSLSSQFLGTPIIQDEYVYFSTPTTPLDSDCVDFDPSQIATYHSAFYLRELSRLGYRPIPIPEGQAIVLSEAESEGWTAVGISFGMSFVNISVVKEKRLLRVVTQTKAGNWIDSEVALETGLTLPEVKKRRQKFDPTKIQSSVDLALRTRYRQVMNEILNRLDSIFVSMRTQDQYPMIWAGPMTTISSFADLAREVFNDRSLEQTFSARITGQRRGRLPSTTVVEGLLKRAIGEYHDGP